MKKIKMGLLALAAMSSIGSAFAFSPASKRNAVTYYAIKTGSKTFHWTTQEPRLECQATIATSACTITTATPPTDNLVPAGHAVTNMVRK